jgi:hypothetical protein
MENENKMQPANPKLETAEVQETQEEVQINEQKLNLYIEKIKLEQNLILGLGGAFAASLIGAVLWATITVVTEYQIGYMAIAIGFFVGYSVRFFGKGISTVFGVIGASFALLGCLMGNLFSLIGFFANAEGYGYFETLGMIDFSLIPEIMIESFSPMDILFYGIAIYEGYKFSFREITEEEILANAVD